MTDLSNHPTSFPETGEVFSDYVALLAAGGEPTLAEYEAVREQLRSLLVREMHRRGVWNAPPAFLGCSGSRWSEGGLEELISDLYMFVFIKRLNSLVQRQDKLPQSLPAVIGMAVGQFLTYRQKLADPLGYRLFGRLRKAVALGAERQWWWLVTGDDPIRNHSRVAFSETPDATRSSAGRDVLGGQVAVFCEGLLPELVTAEGPGVPKVVEELARRLRGLEDLGIGGFRFGDLITEVKGYVRRTWHVAWEDSLGPMATEYAEGERVPRQVAVNEPEDAVAWVQWKEAVQDCVEMAIDEERKPKAKRDLRSLWFRICVERLRIDELGELPSFAELGRQLELTRDRVRTLFERLRPMVEICLRTVGKGSGS